MKTFVKIALITVITAFALISCEPTITDPHNEWWDEYNSQNDASKNTLNAYGYNFTVIGNLSTGTTAVNSVTVQISDPTADIFKESKPETKLKGFLSFYTFNPTELTSTQINAGNTHTLTVLSDWSLEKQVGDTFYLKFPSTFTASSSNLVYKIDSTKYTYSGGNKMDRDGNGVPGEPIYDDVYNTLYITGITNTGTPSLPGRNRIFVTLSRNYPNLNFATATDLVSGKGNFVILSAGDIYNSFLTADDKDDLLKLIVGGIKLEKFTESDGKWSSSGFTAVFDDSTTPHRIVIKDLQATHMTAYRFVFEKGSINLVTNKEYYGVKQRIFVSLEGVSGSVSNNKTSPTRLERYEGTAYNDEIREFLDLQESYYDSPGINDITYTTSWTWSPGWVKGQVYVTDKPNPSYDYHKADPSDDDYDSDYDVDPVVSLGLGDPSYVDIDNSDYLNWMYYDGYSITNYYTQFHACSPTSPPDSPSTTTDSNQSNVYNPPSNYDEPYSPGESYPYTYNSGWVWGSSQSPVRGSTTSSSTPESVYRNRSALSIYSKDSDNKNIVLKLEIGPNSVLKNTVTTRYYIKELDLATFKNNFKIYYSRNNNYNGVYSNDAVEIGIDKVEFKQEKTAQDPFVETSTVKYSGYNVIYITLDPNYKQNTPNYRDKYFYIGKEFGYNDGINVFSSSDIWSNKGFIDYNFGTTF